MDSSKNGSWIILFKQFSRVRVNEDFEDDHYNSKIVKKKTTLNVNKATLNVLKEGMRTLSKNI